MVEGSGIDPVGGTGVGIGGIGIVVGVGGTGVLVGIAVGVGGIGVNVGVGSACPKDKPGKSRKAHPLMNRMKKLNLNLLWFLA